VSLPHFAATAERNQAGNGSVVHHYERIGDSRQPLKYLHRASLTSHRVRHVAAFQG